MKKIMACIVLAFMLSSCAPFPNKKFFPGIKEPTPLEEVEIIPHYGIVESTIECNKRLPWHQIILNCIGNACIVMGCAEVHWDAEGRVTKCEYWSSFKGGIFEEHEIQHCKGYKDTLY